MFEICVKRHGICLSGTPIVPHITVNMLTVLLNMRLERYRTMKFYQIAFAVQAFQDVAEVAYGASQSLD